MTDYIHTGIYHMDIRNFDYEAAHIYEHLLIRSFMNSLERRGYSTFLSGWLNGQTFKSTMFIDYTFYNNGVEVAFRQFIESTHRIDWTLLDNEIDRIQSEVQQIATGINKLELERQLKLLDSKLFTGHHRPIKTEYYPKELKQDLGSDVIVLKRASRKFRNLTVLFGAEKLSEDEQLAFLRSAPFIHDFIDKVLFSLGAYKQDWGFTLDRPCNGMIGLDIYTVKRGGLRAGKIEERLHDNVSMLTRDIEKHSAQLKEYRKAFLRSPQWEDFPVQYYKWAGILTSRENIAVALTQKNIVSILKKMKFKVVQTRPEHWEAT